MPQRLFFLAKFHRLLLLLRVSQGGGETQSHYANINVGINSSTLLNLQTPS